jgi:hypothetical protein
MFGNITFFIAGTSADVSCLIFAADGATTDQANFGTANFLFDYANFFCLA